MHNEQRKTLIKPKHKTGDVTHSKIKNITQQPIKKRMKQIRNGKETKQRKHKATNLEKPLLDPTEQPKKTSNQSTERLCIIQPNESSNKQPID